ncbi:2-hydroxyacid dehydrogenase [Xylophilus rhododendri]|uniref:2-hydroxyacid dehydrogenase n=1 Tax=Xylophilus rhododendri TaxID=2697032 RepID=A0A857J5T9_9BURK|nr:2-hydroxyacid dehydrogenase [Xylophilus rhododendri]QHI98351.1 2-hydroxyacid dehydrogenase [Xylophilus rhododendri]
MPETHRTLLQIGPLPPGLEQALQRQYRIETLWTQPDRAAFLAARRGGFDGAVTMSRHGAQADVFECLGARVLACFGTGFDGIDLAAAARAGCAVSTTPDVLSECVADLAFGLMLASARQLVTADRFVRDGRWLQGGFGLGSRVWGQRLGIVGLGRIGTAIARRAEGFGMQLRYQGRRAHAHVPWAFEPDLAALADWCDYLVLACPGGAATRHLVNATVLRALGPGGYLVNIARGSVVDEQALIDALAAGEIAGAGLDVFEQEPDVPQALLQDDRVVLLPHIAASTRQTRAAMEQLVLDNLQAFFATGRVLTPPV